MISLQENEGLNEKRLLIAVRITFSQSPLFTYIFH